MDFHECLKIAGGALALFLFAPFIVRVFKDGGIGQSFATWFLWLALDTTSAISLWEQHGNYQVSVGFALGGLAMTLSLVYKRRFGWTRFETAILFLVLGCLVAWHYGGPKAATISATLAIFVAGIPGFIELWRHPNRKVGNLWGWYTVANLLSLFGGRDMSIQERFAPAVFAIYSTLMFVAGRRRTAGCPQPQRV